MYSLQSSLDVLLGECLTGSFDSQVYVDWAVRAMLAGYDSESLHILAGSDGEPTHVKEYYLDLTVAELDLEKPSDEDCLLRRYADWIAVEVVSGRILPEDGLNKLYDICIASGYDIDYQIFYELTEDIEGLRGGVGTVFGEIGHLGEKDRMIVHICSLFLSCPLPIPDMEVSKKFDPNRAYCHRCRGRVDHHYVSRWSGWCPPRKRRVALCSCCGLEGVAVPGEG